MGIAMGKKKRKIITLLIAICLFASAVLAATSAYEYYNGKRNCDWCGDKIFEEGTQMRNFWLHDRCASNLLFEYGWYKESNAGVIDEICKELERRER